MRGQGEDKMHEIRRMWPQKPREQRISRKKQTKKKKVLTESNFEKFNVRAFH